jgi:hypothetical protein
MVHPEGKYPANHAQDRAHHGHPETPEMAAFTRELGGRLAPEWARRFPELFDDDDRRLAEGPQGYSGYHFYDCVRKPRSARAPEMALAANRPGRILRAMSQENVEVVRRVYEG